MLKLSTKLPFGRRLSVSIAKSKKPSGEPLVPSIDKLRNIRSGDKISRFFRHFFEHKQINIKKVLGSNLAFAVIASSLLPGATIAGNLPKNEQEAVIVTENVPLSTESGVGLPLENIKINQGYRLFHPGVDFDGITGEPVTPIMGGRVVEIQFSRFAYGNAIIVNHGSGLTSLYAHLSTIEVKKGDLVTKNTKLGEVGSTGWSTGDHLHLEIRDNGIPVNPFSVMPRH